MKFCHQLPNFQVISEASKFSELNYNDIDYNLPDQISNKYYSVGELQKLNISKNFNIFHVNVNSLQNKVDSLHKFLSSTSNELDVVAITETSQKIDDFLRPMLLLKAMPVISLGLLQKKVVLQYMPRINSVHLNRHKNAKH